MTTCVCCVRLCVFACAYVCALVVGADGVQERARARQALSSSVPSSAQEMLRFGGMHSIYGGMRIALERFYRSRSVSLVNDACVMRGSDGGGSGGRL